MNNLNYHIKPAAREQIDHIAETYWKPTSSWQQNRYRYRTYVATDAADTLLGYLAIDEKDIPIPPYGKDWFIVTIVVFHAYRRCGIGTALLDHAFAEARRLGVLHFQGSANPTKEAQGFWSKNGFAFLKCGAAKHDPSKPKEFGNHAHFIFRRVEPIPFSAFLDSLQSKTPFPLPITDASQTELDDLFAHHIAKACTSYVANKRSESHALCVHDKSGLLGFVVFFDEALAAPLHGTQRFLSYLYVRERDRRRGIAKALLCKFSEQAQHDGIDQIVNVHPDEAVFPFFSSLGFDIFITRYLMSFPNGKYSMGIGKRIKEGSRRKNNRRGQNPLGGSYFPSYKIFFVVSVRLAKIEPASAITAAAPQTPAAV